MVKIVSRDWIAEPIHGACVIVVFVPKWESDRVIPLDELTNSVKRAVWNEGEQWIRVGSELGSWGAGHQAGSAGPDVAEKAVRHDFQL